MMVCDLLKIALKIKKIKKAEIKNIMNIHYLILGVIFKIHHNSKIHSVKLVTLKL
jgi:hypothetical protein